MASGTRSYTVLQAAQATPSLARLTELSQTSTAMLKAIEPLVPAALRYAIKAGPIDTTKGGNWCLILDNNATAAKVRQLLPAFAAHLRSKGWEVSAIRLKVQSAPSANSAYPR